MNAAWEEATRTAARITTEDEVARVAAEEEGVRTVAEEEAARTVAEERGRARGTRSASRSPGCPRLRSRTCDVHTRHVSRHAARDRHDRLAPVDLSGDPGGVAAPLPCVPGEAHVAEPFRMPIL